MLGFRFVRASPDGATATLQLDSALRGLAYDHQRDVALVTTRPFTYDRYEMGRVHVVETGLHDGEPLKLDGTPDALKARHVDSGDGAILERAADGTVRVVTGVDLEIDGLLYHRGGRLVAPPTAIAVDARRNRLLIARWNRAEIREVDLATGVRALQSGDKRGVGPPLSLPFALAVDETFAYVTVPSGVIAVDLVTSDRVFLASAR